MNRIFSLSIIALSLYSTPTLSAGFDCALASTSTEKTICADAELSALDSELNSVYKSNLAQNPALKQEQRDWIKNVRNKTKTSLDLIAAYKVRIAEISGANSQVTKVTTDIALTPEPVVNQAPSAEQDIQEATDTTETANTSGTADTADSDGSSEATMDSVIDDALDTLAKKVLGSNIEIVKNGVLESNKTITIGNALDKWKNCKSREWKETKSDNGVKGVQFICYLDYTAHMKQIKDFYVQTDGYKFKKQNGEDDLSLFDIKSIETVVNFTMNLDHTFQHDRSIEKIIWNNGKSYRELTNALGDAYANNRYYAPTLTKSGAEQMFNVLRYKKDLAD